MSYSAMGGSFAGIVAKEASNEWFICKVFHRISRCGVAHLMGISLLASFAKQFEMSRSIIAFFCKIMAHLQA